jgi:hypothetical protein
VVVTKDLPPCLFQPLPASPDLGTLAIRHSGETLASDQICMSRANWDSVVANKLDGDEAYQDSRSRCERPPRDAGVDAGAVPDAP